MSIRLARDGRGASAFKMSVELASGTLFQDRYVRQGRAGKRTIPSVRTTEDVFYRPRESLHFSTEITHVHVTRTQKEN